MNCPVTSMSKVIGCGQCQTILQPAHTISQTALPEMPQHTQLGKHLKGFGLNHPGITHRTTISNL
nr:MAG TPA: hypothetical protein [Caudoviricetes sp.]